MTPDNPKDWSQTPPYRDLIPASSPSLLMVHGVVDDDNDDGTCNDNNNGDGPMDLPLGKGAREEVGCPSPASSRGVLVC